MASPALTFRNSHGDLIDVVSVPASELKNKTGKVLEKAAAGAVAITKHDAPKFVLVPFAEFQALVESRSPNLNMLDQDFEELVQGMQTTRSRKAVAAAFDATPEQMGRAAVAAAKKKRR
jgi:antitoxin Phd